MQKLASFLSDTRVHGAILALIAAGIMWAHPATDQTSAMQLAGWILTVVLAWLLPSGAGAVPRTK